MSDLSKYAYLKEYDLDVHVSGKVYNARNGRELKPCPDKSGYLRVYPKRNNKRCGLYIHRAVAMAFIPNPEGKPDVNHKDGDKTNNSAINLEWVTKSENTRHAYSTGLLKGTGAREMKKRNDAIRDLYATGKYTHKDIAEVFDMTAPNITRILNYKQTA